MYSEKLFSPARSLAAWAAVFGLMMLAASPARAAFHLWGINEVYSNASGTLQFIELFDGPPADPFGGQNFIGGLSISVTDASNSQTNIFNIPGGDVLSGNTLNHMLLFGT